MGECSKGCSSSFSSILERIVRDPFKKGIVGRSYDDFLVHNHVHSLLIQDTQTTNVDGIVMVPGSAKAHRYSARRRSCPIR